MKPRSRRKKRDLTFPLVIGLLLLFVFAVDEMFVRLRTFLVANGGLHGLLAYPDLKPVVKPLRPNHCRGPVRSAKGHDPAWPACPGTETAAAPAAEPVRAPASIPAEGVAGLAFAETLRIDQVRESLRARAEARTARERDRWEAVEPMPSNPSRLFPEPRHPVLSSGVALTTAPDDPPRTTDPENEKARVRSEPRPRFP